MTDSEQKRAAAQFVKDWLNRGDEKQDTQQFWTSLLQKVFGVKEPEKQISFEKRVIVDNMSTGKSTTKFIDAYLPETRVLIEQKSADIDLRKGEKQSDGSPLTPYQQARRYGGYLSDAERPRWIITCNFREFQIHDMNNPNGEPEVLLLKDLEKEFHRLDFIVQSKNEHIQKEMAVSIAAGRIVGKIYDAFAKQYKDPGSEHTLRSLNKLCVRLVFCLYAEDAGIFGDKGMFHDYLAAFPTQGMRKALLELFRVLDTPENQRDPYLKDDDPQLAAFPYVNGGLFKDEDVEIPSFTDEIKELLLVEASENFNWSEISPTIFGAVFESTLNPETRRKGGMHYTSIENIHKVIDPLFLEDLKQEFAEISAIAAVATRKNRLQQFQNKLAGLTFLDPACGSGNFLTETYLSLRRLENQTIAELIAMQKGQVAGQIVWGGATSVAAVKVSISHFYGIEINDFAVTVAKTALWIAESQMLKETEAIIQEHLDFLPLKTNAYIVEGNALRMDWESIVPKRNLSYIMGNPPFVGKKEQSAQQKEELVALYGKNIPGTGNMDYVTGWYIKAAEYMQGTGIKSAFVSTNSITQGEQPAVLWTKLQQYHVEIIFAYRTFDWSSEANLKAHVHCVIIGFCTYTLAGKKTIYDKERVGIYSIKAEHINPYLIDAPTVLITSRSKPICNVPEMCYGSMPIDNNNLILDEEAVTEILKENPENENFIREYVGGEELLNGKRRWCLWLDGIDPRSYIRSKIIMGRIAANREYRLHGSNRPQTNKAAETPQLFGEIRQPRNGALVIPKVSSEDRRYIPISYVKPGIIINGSALMLPEASLYHFGILSSGVHNSWMRVVAGRMKSDYQYSGKIVYNNFPWPDATETQIAEIKECAQEVLNAREKYPDMTLAEMYKMKNFEVLIDLKKAHNKLNLAVRKAYGFSSRSMTEEQCVAELMKRYQKLIGSKG